MINFWKKQDLIFINRNLTKHTTKAKNLTIVNIALKFKNKIDSEIDSFK